jgi:phage-related protein
VTDVKWWIHETITSFRTDMTSNSGNLNYPFNYPFNFASSSVGKTVSNESYAPSDFEIIIYGACTNPLINIAGHSYGVNCSLETGEYLKIVSITKKIYKVKTNGEIVNQFNLRDRDSYIFEKIPSGENAVTWSGLFGFDVVLLAERSEPKWI